MGKRLDWCLEFWSGIFNVAFTIVVSYTFALIYFKGGSVWVYEDKWWILYPEIAMCIIALPLSIERLYKDVKRSKTG